MCVRSHRGCSFSPGAFRDVSPGKCPSLKPPWNPELRQPRLQSDCQVLAGHGRICPSVCGHGPGDCVSALCPLPSANTPCPAPAPGMPQQVGNGQVCPRDPSGQCWGLAKCLLQPQLVEDGAAIPKSCVMEGGGGIRRVLGTETQSLSSQARAGPPGPSSSLGPTPRWGAGH